MANVLGHIGHFWGSLEFGRQVDYSFGIRQTKLKLRFSGVGWKRFVIYCLRLLRKYPSYILLVCFANWKFSLVVHQNPIICYNLDLLDIYNIGFVNSEE